MERERETEDIGLWRPLRTLSVDTVRRIARFYSFTPESNGTIFFTHDDRTIVHRNNDRLGLHELRMFRDLTVVKVLVNFYHLFLVYHSWVFDREELYASPCFKIRETQIKLLARGEIRQIDARANWLFILDSHQRCWCWNSHDENASFQHDTPMKLVDLPAATSLDGELIQNFGLGLQTLLILTNRNRLFLAKTYNNYYSFTGRLALNPTLSYRKLVPFGENEFLMLSNDGRADYFNASVSNELITDRIYNSKHDQLADIYSAGSLGYILVRKADGKCVVWDATNSQMTETDLVSVPDAHCLYLEGTTPVLTVLPASLTEPGGQLEQLGHFNDSTYRLDAANRSDNIKFQVNYYNHDIYVQRSKLSQHSEYFRRQFETEWRNNELVVITTFQYATVYQYFRYVYTGILPRFTDQDQIILLYQLADQWQDTKLQRLITDRTYDESYGKIWLKPAADGSSSQEFAPAMVTGEEIHIEDDDDHHKNKNPK